MQRENQIVQLLNCRKERFDDRLHQFFSDVVHFVLKNRAKALAWLRRNFVDLDWFLVPERQTIKSYGFMFAIFAAYIVVMKMALKHGNVTDEERRILDNIFIKSILLINVPYMFLQILGENRNFREAREEEEELALEEAGRLQVWDRLMAENGWNLEAAIRAQEIARLQDEQEVREIARRKTKRLRILEALHANRLAGENGWKQREKSLMAELDKIEENLSVSTKMLRDFVNALPEQPGSPGDTCGICLCEFEAGDYRVVTPCTSRHGFHGDCLKEWFLTKRRYPRCPLCTQSLSFVQHMERGGRRR